MCRATIVAAAFVVAVLPAISAEAAGKQRPPLLSVLQGGWFNVTVRGSYNMHWSANVHDNCGGDPMQPEFLDAQASEMLTFAAKRPARAFLFETMVPGIRSGPPIPTLVLRSRVYARGAKLVPNDLAPLGVAAPASWTRALSGTYQDCGEMPKTLAPHGCGRFVTPRFSTLLSPSSDSRRYHGKISMGVSERSNSTLPEASCQAQTYAGLPFPSHVIGFLQNSEDVTLRCPPPAAVVSISVRTTASCHLYNRDNGFLSGVRETLVVTFRRLS
jgi:hypothetical protein